MVQSLWETVWCFLKRFNTKLPYDPCNSSPRYLPKRTENRDSDRYLDIHSSSDHNSPKMKTAQMSISGGMFNQLGSFTQWKIRQPWRAVRYWYLLQSEGTSRISCWGKEARHQRSHIVWCSLYGMSRTGDSIKTQCRFGGCQEQGGMGWNWGVGEGFYFRAMEMFWK